MNGAPEPYTTRELECLLQTVINLQKTRKPHKRFTAKVGKSFWQAVSEHMTANGWPRRSWQHIRNKTEELKLLIGGDSCDPNRLGGPPFINSQLSGLLSSPSTLFPNVSTPSFNLPQCLPGSTDVPKIVSVSSTSTSPSNPTQQFGSPTLRNHNCTLPGQRQVYLVPPPAPSHSGSPLDSAESSKPNTNNFGSPEFSALESSCQPIPVPLILSNQQLQINALKLEILAMKREYWLRKLRFA